MLCHNSSVTCRDTRTVFLAIALLLGACLGVSQVAPAAAKSFDLSHFAGQVVPVGPQVIAVIGAAVEPEVDAAAFTLAVTRTEQERPRIEKILTRVERYWARVLQDGAKGAKGARALLKRISAHEPLVGALGGATLLRSPKGALAGPMEGGKNHGPTFQRLSKLLAAEVIVCLAKGDKEGASKALAEMARFGALVSESARTLDELSSGLRASQSALGVMVRLAELGELKGGQGGVETIQEAHRALGRYARTLQSARAALGKRPRLEVLAELARNAGRSLWRYEAFKGLRGAAWAGVGTERGQDAERYITQIAEAPQVPNDVKRAALETLAKLGASR